MSARSFLLLWLLPLCLLLAGCTATSSKNDESLGALVVARLEWMDDVAQFKQAHGLPVTDPAREAALLQTMTQRGAETGLPSAAVRRFFAGQMAAAREYQKEWLASPHAAAATAAAPDLQKTVRPALDTLGHQMLAALSQARASQNHAAILSDAHQRLTTAGYSKEVIALAMGGLKAGLSR